MIIAFILLMSLLSICTTVGIDVYTNPISVAERRARNANVKHMTAWAARANKVHMPQLHNTHKHRRGH